MLTSKQLTDKSASYCFAQQKTKDNICVCFVQTRWKKLHWRTNTGLKGSISNWDTVSSNNKHDSLVAALHVPAHK